MSNKQISQDRWVEFFDQFTNGNRGRLIKLEIVDRDSGDQIPIQNASLWSLVYDPVNKGNDLTIATGRDEVTYAHTIHAGQTHLNPVSFARQRFRFLATKLNNS